MKKSAKLIITVIAVIFFVVVLAFLVQIGMFSELFTQYSSNFSYQILRQINKGSSKNEVHQLLGEPLYTTGTTTSCDWYSRIKNSWSDISGWVGVYVCYSDRNTVTVTGSSSF